MSELNELAAALAKAQGEIEPAPKDAENPFYKSRYATLSSVIRAIRAPFARNGLSVVQIPEVLALPDVREVTVFDKYGKPKKKTIDGELRLHTLLMHSSGQQMQCGTLITLVDMSDPQAIGTAISYSRRYAISAVAGACADEDDDGNSASGRRQQAPEHQRQPESKRQQPAPYPDPPQDPPSPTEKPDADAAKATCKTDDAKLAIEAIMDAAKSACKTDDAKLAIEAIMACGTTAAIANAKQTATVKALLDGGDPEDLQVFKTFANNYHKYLWHMEQQ